MQIYLEQGEENGLNKAAGAPCKNIIKENIIESILFSSGEPVSFAEIAESLEISKNDARDMTLKFAESYNARNTGLEIIILEDNAQITARAENIEYIRRVLKSGTRQARVLSKPALEILAILAYNQPVTRNYIEQIRGVDCAYMLGSLMERGYIEEKGVLEIPGRPRLYGTTIKFLAQFGLSDLSELPEIDKFRESLVNENEEE